MMNGMNDGAQAATPGARGWRLEHSYGQLPSLLHVAVGPTAVRAPRVVVWNRILAEELGLDAEAWAGVVGDGATAAEIFSGNVLPPGAVFDSSLHGHCSQQVGDDELVTAFIRA